jgi:hypothetical protein
MKEIIITISAWFSIIFYPIMSLVALIVLLTEEFNYAVMVTIFMFLSMAVNGFYARKIGNTDFKTIRISKLFAIFNLIFGIFFVVLVPILFSTLFNINESYSIIIALFILYGPAVITSLAILTAKPHL